MPDCSWNRFEDCLDNDGNNKDAQYLVNLRAGDATVLAVQLGVCADHMQMLVDLLLSGARDARVEVKAVNR